ncbi:hypothetical protein [Clostridium sp. AM58-1XD]|uniref:N-acetylmuramoyl-L-alanine amidase family protein n=1 Tax=Clostridium sp. AM58-1XD TaxID=2292307 RepID=UPI0015F73872|nr:hypothetical protein [Clostridium sp. AM58-1XD]
MLKKRWGILITMLLISLFLIGGSFQALAKTSDDDDEKEQLEEVSGLWWDDDGEANWDEIEGKYQYEVSLYRDGSRVITVKTKSEKYKFYSKMTKEGEYSFRVRALAKSSSRDYTNGPWSEFSDSFDVDDDYADAVRNKKTSSKDDDDDDSSDSKPTGNTGWQEDQTGWWWLRSNGSYPKNEWMTINDKRYYFNSDGYMVTGWVEIDGKNYFFDGSGAYQPDGGNGQPSATGEWKHDNAGWWWKESNGSNPVNRWEYINNKWYFFDSTGYMKTGWISWNNLWYYCDASGAMVTDNYVEGSHWVDSSGVCRDR